MRTSIVALLLALTASCAGATHITAPPAPATSNAPAIAPDEASTGTEPSPTPLTPAPEARDQAAHDVNDPSHIADPPLLASPPRTSPGRDLRSVAGIEHAGACCRSTRDCGGLACAHSPFATCSRMCQIACRAGDTCPAIGGGTGAPQSCPGPSAFCPVTPPGA